MLKTYPLHPTPQPRPESLRQIFTRLERELASQPPRPHRHPVPTMQRSTLPF
jgi:hypothetical protein